MITNIDVTLRDGGYRNSFNFSLEYALAHARSSVASGFDWAEIGYRKGSLRPELADGRRGGHVGRFRSPGHGERGG
ncbi:hypothetical protein ACVLV4_000048 [Rathayibacter agropyri]